MSRGNEIRVIGEDWTAKLREIDGELQVVAPWDEPQTPESKSPWKVHSLRVDLASNVAKESGMMVTTSAGGREIAVDVADGHDARRRGKAGRQRGHVDGRECLGGVHRVFGPNYRIVVRECNATTIQSLRCFGDHLWRSTLAEQV